LGKIEKNFFFRLFLFYLPEDKIVLFQENSLDLKDFYALNRGDYFVGRFTFPSLEQLPRIWNNFRVSRPVARFREVYFPKICLKRDAIFNSEFPVTAGIFSKFGFKLLHLKNRN
jgi:hypothetical protein